MDVTGSERGLRWAVMVLLLSSCVKRTGDAPPPPAAPVQQDAPTTPHEVVIVPEPEPEPEPELAPEPEPEPEPIDDEYVEVDEHGIPLRPSPTPTVRIEVTPGPPPTDADLAQVCEEARKGAHAADDNDIMYVSVFGEPGECDELYWSLLRKRYRVAVSRQSEQEQEQEPSAWKKEHRRCFEDEIHVIVRGRFGEDAFERLQAEAQRRCQERRRRRG